MNAIEQLNQQLFNMWKELPDNNLSYPLLISRNFKFGKEYPKIMYIGKETNQWGKDVEINTEKDLEQLYEKFSTGISDSTKDLWKFIGDFYSYPQENNRNVLWMNAILCGKKKGSGTPTLSKKLKQMSAIYLTFVYEYFRPDIVIIVCGNKNPYYRVIKSFLNQIHADIHEYPTREKPLIINHENTIFWTKHPSYLRVNNQEELVKSQIKEKILK